MSNVEQLSIEKKPEESKFNFSLAIVVFAVSFGTTFGTYNYAVVNNLKPVVVGYLNATSAGSHLHSNPDIVWAIVVASFPIGCAFGTLCSAILAEIAGRKVSLIICSISNALGGLLCLFYFHKFELVIGGRLFLGAAFGLGLPVACTFITEIAPVKYRGGCNAALQGMCALGDLCGMFMSLPETLGVEHLSNVALGFSTLSSVIAIPVLIFAHESPRYLILKCKKVDQATKALIFYQRKTNVQELVNEILAEQQVGLESCNINDNKNNRWIVSMKQLPIKSLTLSILFSGIPLLTSVVTIMGYSTDAMLSNGTARRVTPYCTLTLGICNVLMSIVTLKLIDKWGRKRLFMLGNIGCFLGTFGFAVISLINIYAKPVFGFGYILVACFDIFALGFSLFNAACLTIAPEVVSQHYRSYAMCIGSLLNQIISTVSVLTYEPIKSAWGISWVYFPYTCLSFALGMLLNHFLTETAGVTLTDIKRQYTEKK